MNNDFRRICLRRAAAFCASLLLFNAPLAPVMAGEEETHIVINKTKNTLTVMMNDVPVYHFRVATGRSGLTPSGRFQIVTKVHHPYYLRQKIAGGHPDNPLGTRWMGLNVGNGYKYGIHGTNRPASIGHSVSSGCIRMRNRDVEFLFRHIPLKTYVIIED